MDAFYEPFAYALDRWWQIGLTILASSAAILLADFFGLTRPWPFPVVLGGILAYMILEAYPYGWVLGEFAGIGLWVVMSLMVHLLPYWTKRLSSLDTRTLWDHFERVDF